MLDSFWTFIKPEIFLASMACLILVVDVCLPKNKKGWTFLLTQVTLVMSIFLCLDLLDKPKTITLNNHFVLDVFSQDLKAFMLFIMSAVMLYSRDYISTRNIEHGEYYILSLFSALGMMVMISANSTLSMYLGLELLSLPLYTLVAMNRDSQTGVEASMKYFIMGALASGMLLYGISILFGATGSLELSSISEVLNQVGDENSIVTQKPWILFGLVFITIGVAFKLGAVPFHMWLPDIYAGAPNSVTLLISTAPKLAAFGMLCRFFIDGLGTLSANWSELFMVMAVLSLAIGNLVAIAQTNIKRMLAYSTIAHVGFILLAFITGPQGYIAAMHYTMIYVLMSLGSFGVLVILSKNSEVEKIADLKGLGKRHPWIALMMLLFMFSLAGVPPTIGFYAKFVVVNVLVESGYYVLAGTAMFFSIIGAYYYLKIVKVMYFDEPQSEKVCIALDNQIAISINGLSMLALGLMPGYVYTVCWLALG